MSDGSDLIVEVVAVLTFRGHTVEPDDFERWRVDGAEWLSIGDLLTLAMHLGLSAGVGRLQ